MLALISTLKNKEAEWLTLRNWKIAKEVYKSFWDVQEFTDEQYLKRLQKAIVKEKLKKDLQLKQ